MKEKEIIALIQTLKCVKSEKTIIGIGDDAAVIKFVSPVAISSDAFIESVHFDRSYMSARDIGHKALASALSDLAAMAARPRVFTMTLAIPKSCDSEFIKELLAGLDKTACAYHCELIGGDTTRSPGPLMIDIQVIGEVERPTRLSTAQSGDVVCVSGALGLAAKGLELLQKKQAQIHPSFCEAHCRPQARVDFALLLNENFAISSMTDISDGLARELHTVAAQSNVGIDIVATQIPTYENSTQALHFALNGGEDYELLFTLPEAEFTRLADQQQYEVFRIGLVTSQSGVVRISQNNSWSSLDDRGWDPF